jgi:hypothetical protein
MEPEEAAERSRGESGHAAVWADERGGQMTRRCQRKLQLNLNCEVLEGRQLLSNFLSVTGTGATGAVLDVRGVTTDSAGNVYEVGTFGNVGSVATFGSHKITSTTASAIFVAKFSPTKGWLWATAVDPGSPAMEYSGNGIVIDGLGRVDVVGGVRDAVIPSSIVVAQLDGGTGAIYWVHIFGGPNNAGSTATGIAQQPIFVAPGSALDITGTISGTITFGGQVSSNSTSDMFVGQLTETGAAVWGRALPIIPTDVASGSGITIDHSTGRIFTVGTFSTTSPPTSALLVAEYTAGGSFVTAAKPLGAVPNSAGTGISVDGAGHLYVTGRSTGALVAKLFETTLLPIWSHDFVAPGGTAAALGVAVDTAGIPYVTGAFSGTINFGAGAVTSAGSTDVFVAKLNPFSGLAIWSDAGGGIGPDIAKSIAFNIANSRVYAVGDYTPPAKFGPFALGAFGAKNIFLASLA